MCRRDLFSLCESSNPNAWIAGKLMGHSPAGLFGFAVYAYREAILACRGGGTVSVIVVYGGFIERTPSGSRTRRGDTRCSSTSATTARRSCSRPESTPRRYRSRRTRSRRVGAAGTRPSPWR